MEFPTTYLNYLNLVSNLFFGKGYNGAQKENPVTKFVNDFVLSNLNKKSYEESKRDLQEKRDFVKYIHEAPFHSCAFDKEGDVYSLIIDGLPLACKFIAKGASGFIFLGNDGFIYKFVTSPMKSAVINNILKEVVIQKLLSLIQYTNQRGESVQITPTVHNFMYCSNNLAVKDNTIIVQPFNENMWNCVIKMDRAHYEFRDIFYETKKDLIPMLQDFLAIQRTIADMNIFFNHCDMKYNNIMYNEKKQMQMIDFGYTSMIFPITLNDKVHHVTFFSNECKWKVDETIRGYYQGKDIVQLILTLYLLKYDDAHTLYEESTQLSKEFIYMVLHQLGLFNMDEDGNVVYSPLLQEEVQHIQTKYAGRNPPDWIVAYNYESHLRQRIPVNKVSHPTMKRMLNQYTTRNVNRVKTTNNLSRRRANNRTQRNGAKSL